LESIFRQTLLPQQVIVVVTSPEDLPDKTWDQVQFIVGPVGICKQRNRALAAIPPTVDYVGFFDDDFELKSDYLAEAALFLQRCPGTVAISGFLLADGHITRDEARRLVTQHIHQERTAGLFYSSGDLHALHGCNMIIRRPFLEYEKFDETFPLYGFAEDYDLSVRLERYGKIGKFARCIGVHLAWRGGRINEIQHGYSLIANQWYCIQKGTVHAPPFEAQVWFWKIVVGRMLFRTLGKILKRDQSLDWVGRLKGLCLALWDILMRRCHPGRILELGIVQDDGF
jgi:GT2 family glycosyltransferase